MSTVANIELQRNKELVERLLNAFDNHEFERLEEFYWENFELHHAGEHRNLQQVREMAKVYYAAFPDLCHDLEEVTAFEDRVIFRAMIRGTHQGEFLGIAATGKPIAFSQMSMLRIIDGKISEIWEEADLMSMWQQLGVQIPGE